MGQGVAGQIGVDQGRGDTDLGKPQPGGDVFGPVEHHQGDGVPTLEPPTLGPVAEAVGHGVKLAIGHRATVVPDSYPLAKLVNGLFPVVTDQIGTVQLDGLDALEQTAQPLGEAQIALDIRHQTHRRHRSAGSRPCRGDEQAARPGQPAGESGRLFVTKSRRFVRRRGANAAVPGANLPKSDGRL